MSNYTIVFPSGFTQQVVLSLGTAKWLLKSMLANHGAVITLDADQGENK